MDENTSKFSSGKITGALRHDHADIVQVTRILNAYISRLIDNSSSCERQSSIALKYVALALCVSRANRPWLEKLANLAVDWEAVEQETAPGDRENEEDSGGPNPQSKGGGRSVAIDDLACTPPSESPLLDLRDATRGSTELPSIPSVEDTDEERERQRSYAPWTRSSDLEAQLEAQSKEHPRHIFGDVPPVTVFGSKGRKDTRPTLSPSSNRGGHGARPVPENRTKSRSNLAAPAASKGRRKKYLGQGLRRPNKTARAGLSNNETPETRVATSYLLHDCGAVPVEFGPPDEGCFNPYRVRASHPRAVLTSSLLRKVEHCRRDFWINIPCCLDDRQLEQHLYEPDSGIQKILRSASAASTLQDMMKEISLKLQRNVRLKHLLDFIESCIFRMDQYKNPEGQQVRYTQLEPSSPSFPAVLRLHLDR